MDELEGFYIDYQERLSESLEYYGQHVSVAVPKAQEWLTEQIQHEYKLKKPEAEKLMKDTLKKYR